MDYVLRELDHRRGREDSEARRKRLFERMDAAFPGATVDAAHPELAIRAIHKMADRRTDPALNSRAMLDELTQRYPAMNELQVLLQGR